MLRSSALILLLAACAVADEDATWGELACSGEVQGSLETRTWCDGEWRTWHAEDKAASAGRIVDGVHQPAYAMWWPDGKPASEVKGSEVVMYDVAGEEQGKDPALPAGADACDFDEAARRLDITSEAGHRRVLCEQEVLNDAPVPEGEGKPLHGRMTTFYADGSVESVQFYVDGERHGPFEAYHPGGSAGAVGPVWVRGAYANGKKHGPWLTFDKAGKVFQPAVEDAWKDHTPVRTWVQQTAGQVGSGS